MREGGLGATAFPPDGHDHWPGWEDSAVPPERSGDYLRDLKRLYREYDYSGAIYGHIGQGCIHSRIDFDLRSAEGIRTYRSFLEEAADLVVSYGGSLSGEHGDGQQRAELLPKQYDEEIVGAFRRFKSIWDPDWKMNPGKVVDPYRFGENLKLGTDYNPWRPDVKFAYEKDGGDFAHAALRCVGVGVGVGVGKCRKPDGVDKATGGIDPEQELLEQMGVDSDLVTGGCCGLAGSWGFEAGHHDISLQAGEQALLPKVREAEPTTLIVANGFSCKTQIEQGQTGRRALHLAQVIKLAREHGAGGPPGTLAEREYYEVRPASRRRSLVRLAGGAGLVAATRRRGPDAARARLPWNRTAGRIGRAATSAPCRRSSPPARFHTATRSRSGPPGRYWPTPGAPRRPATRSCTCSERSQPMRASRSGRFATFGRRLPHGRVRSHSGRRRTSSRCRPPSACGGARRPPAHGRRRLAARRVSRNRPLPDRHGAAAEPAPPAMITMGFANANVEPWPRQLRRDDGDGTRSLRRLLGVRRETREEITMDARLLHETDGLRTYVLVFDKGDEVKEGIEKFARDKDVSAAQFTAIGALSDVVFG